MKKLLTLCLFIGYLCVCVFGEPITEIKCKTDIDCSTITPGSVCNNTACICPINTIISSDLTRCLTQVDGFGSKCEDTSQCALKLKKGGTCSDGTCTCRSGYHYLNGYCWKDAKLNEACTTREECFQSYENNGFECKEGKCQCREGFYERKGCRRVIEAGGFCNIKSDCHCGDGQTATCEKYKCTCTPEDGQTGNVQEHTTDVQITPEHDGTCKPGEFFNNGTCSLELNMPCSTNANCLAGVKYTECVLGLCGCQPKFSESMNQRNCIKAALANSSIKKCTENSSCSIFGGDSYCENFNCVCRDGTHFVEEDQLCWPSTQLNGQCESDRDCEAEDSECKEKQCQCKQGYHPSDQTCRQDGKTFGDPCIDSADCMFPNSMCNVDKGTCQCQSNYFFNNETCQNGVGSECLNSMDCQSVENSMCTKIENGMLCTCYANYTSSADFSKCLKVMSYNDSCEEVSQCDLILGDNRRCKDGRCLCGEEEHFVNGLCFTTRALGEKCHKRSECWTDHGTNGTMCQNGICSCQYGYERSEENNCLKKDADSSGFVTGKDLLLMVVAVCIQLYVMYSW